MTYISYHRTVRFFIKLCLVFSFFLSQSSLFAGEILHANKATSSMCTQLKKLSSDFDKLVSSEFEARQEFIDADTEQLKYFCDVFKISPLLISSSNIRKECEKRVQPYKKTGLKLLAEYKQLILSFKKFLTENKSDLSSIAFGLIVEQEERGLSDEEAEDLVEVSIDDLSEKSRDSSLFFKSSLEEVESFPANEFRAKFDALKKKTSAHYIDLATQLMIEDNNKAVIDNTKAINNENFGLGTLVDLDTPMPTLEMKDFLDEDDLGLLGSDTDFDIDQIELKQELTYEIIYAQSHLELLYKSQCNN